jgi:hypothetical protein
VRLCRLDDVGEEPSESFRVVSPTAADSGRLNMGRGLLLWIIGIPLPIILIVWLLGGLS